MRTVYVLLVKRRHQEIHVASTRLLIGLHSNDSCSMPHGKSSVKFTGGVATCSRVSGETTGSYFAQGIHWGLSSFGNPHTKAPQRVGSVHLMHEGLHEPTLAGANSVQVSILPPFNARTTQDRHLL